MTTKQKLVIEIEKTIRENLHLYEDKGYNFFLCYMGQIEIFDDLPQTNPTVWNWCEMQIKGKYVTREYINALDYPKRVLEDWLNFEKNKVFEYKKLEVKK